MRNIRRLFHLFAIVGLGAFYSCTGDENEIENKELTVEEAGAKTDELGTDLANDVIDITQTDGVMAIEDFAGLFDESNSGRLDDKSAKQQVSDLIKNIQQKFGSTTSRISQEEPQTFEELVGIYEWNESIMGFDSVGGSDIIVFRFPTEGSATNNAELRITALEWVEVVDTYEMDGQTYEDVYTMPSKITSDLHVDATLVADLSFAATYTESGDPLTADISLTLVPYTLVVSFDDTAATEAHFEASLEKGEELIVSTAVDITFESSTKEEPTLAEGYVQYRAVKLEGSIDVLALDESESGDPNEYVDLTLYDNNQKVGDIVFIEETDEDGYTNYEPYIEFSDGSTRPLDEVLEPAITELESHFES